MCKTETYLCSSLLLACVAGCQAGIKDQSFTHQHRIDYAISAAEFEDLEFTISAEVIVRAIGEVPEFDSSGSGVIIAPKGTGGTVVAVGSDWLRVTFGLGEGSYFKTDPSKDYDNYWLATEVAGEEGLFMLKNLDEAVLLHDGITYDVVRGSAAYLRVDVDSWKDFVATRTHVPGT